MSTNANVFNSRVTSEALEAKFRQVFPAQAGAELIQDLYASGVIQPVIDFSSVAEGSGLPTNLQTAWDLSTGNTQVFGSTATMISNTGFWQIDLTAGMTAATTGSAVITLTDGVTSKIIWSQFFGGAGAAVTEQKFVVFVKAGESVVATSPTGGIVVDCWYRQIADVYGNLVNPLGFTFS